MDMSATSLPRVYATPETIRSSDVQTALKPVSALTLLQQERQERHTRPCFLQHPALSLPLGITQVYGQAGAGKTQLALSLCVDCVFRNQQAVYIGLGGSNMVGIAARRLEMMVKTRLQRDKEGGWTKRLSLVAAVKVVLSNIFLHWVRNGEDLMELVEGKNSSLSRLLQRHSSISLVVLDGISNLFRLADSTFPNFYQERASIFFRFSSQCKMLSSTFKVPFVVINGATTRIRKEDDSAAGREEHQSLEPALGLSWDQSVNCTFLVSRGSTRQTINTSKDDAKQTTTVIRRVLRCKKSPTIPVEKYLDFSVDNSGAVRMDPAIKSVYPSS